MTNEKPIDIKSEVKYTTWDNVDMWLYEHIIVYKWINKFFVFLRPSHIKGIIKRFFQRLTRGWDDSDTWSLDDKILEFIQPRLQRLGEITVAYPDKYESLEDWKNELFKMSYLLNQLIKYKYLEYEYKKDEYKNENKCIKAYYKDLNMFMVWLKDNLCHLWW